MDILSQNQQEDLKNGMQREFLNRLFKVSIIAIKGVLLIEI
jgi:hypothetical protein